MLHRNIKSGQSSKKDFTVPTPKASKDSNLNFSSHICQSEQEMEYNHMTPGTGLYKVAILERKILLSP